VKWGRNVYDSVAKFLQFQLTVNIAAIIIATVGAIWLNRSPLQPVQMLWVNLIMDSFASLALATEPPHERLLDRPPYGRNKVRGRIASIPTRARASQVLLCRCPHASSLCGAFLGVRGVCLPLVFRFDPQPMISRQMWFNMIGHAVYQLIVIMVILIDGHNLFDVPDGRFSEHNDPPTRHFTIIFNTFVFMQIFNEFNSRKLYGEWNVFDGLSRNVIFIAIIVGTVIAQFIIVQYGGSAFTVTDLTAEQWGWCILFGFLELPWQYVVNLVVMCVTHLVCCVPACLALHVYVCVPDLTPCCCCGVVGATHRELPSEFLAQPEYTPADQDHHHAAANVDLLAASKPRPTASTRREEFAKGPSFIRSSTHRNSVEASFKDLTSGGDAYVAYVWQLSVMKHAVAHRAFFLFVVVCVCFLCCAPQPHEADRTCHQCALVTEGPNIVCWVLGSATVKARREAV